MPPTPAPAVGDGLDEVRSQIQAHVPLSRDVKLAAVLHRLQDDEAGCLRSFQEAQKSGEPWLSLAAPSAVSSARDRLHCGAGGGARVHGAGRGEGLPGADSTPPSRRPCFPPAGNQLRMDEASDSWKFTAERLRLLRKDPDGFVKRFGWYYSIK